MIPYDNHATSLSARGGPLSDELACNRTPTDQSSIRRHNKRLTTAAIRQGVSFATVVFVVIMLFHVPLSAAQPVKELDPPLERPDLFMHHPDISPDGRYIAVSGGREYMGSTIWVFDRVSGQGRQLTETDTTMEWGDLCPRWSPNGDRILFVSDRGREFGVYIVDVASGVMENVVYTPGLSNTWYTQSVWSPDGNAVLYPAKDGRNGENLYKVDLSSREITQVTSESEKKVRFPSWSPNGKHIIYAAQDRSATTRLMMLDVHAGSSRELHAGDREYAFPRWNHTGTWITYHHGGGSNRLFIMSIENPTPIEVLPPTDYQIWGPVWDGDTSRLVFHRAKRNLGPIVIRDFASDSEWQILQMTQLWAAPWASWSTDGQTVAFYAGPHDDRADTSLVTATFATRRTHKSSATTAEHSSLNAPEWNKENTGYLYVAMQEKGSQIVFREWPALNSTTILESDKIIRAMTLSSDEEVIAYIAHSPGDSEAQDIWLFDRVTDDRYQVTFTKKPIETLRFSPDDTKILYRPSGDRNSLYILDLENNESFGIGESDFWHGPNATWLDNDRILYEAAKEGPPVALYEYHVSTRKALLLHGSADHCLYPFPDPRTQKGLFYQSGWPSKALVHVNTESGQYREVIDKAQSPVFSDDGSKVIYMFNKGEPQTSIWSADVSELMHRQLP